MPDDFVGLGRGSRCTSAYSTDPDQLSNPAAHYAPTPGPVPPLDQRPAIKNAPRTNRKDVHRDKAYGHTINQKTG